MLFYTYKQRFKQNEKKEVGTTNLAGGVAYKQSNELKLASLLLTSFREDKFYRSSKETFNELEALINTCDKEFCAKAACDNANKYVFIIDEINRGEISKIFGELFFSIDPGYRGKKGLVKTQYQNLLNPHEKTLDGNNYPFIDGFYVPENVYILGTML